MNILIRKGELLCGNMTKSTIGSSAGGMIHIIWKEKGPYCCRGKSIISFLKLSF